MEPVKYRLIIRISSLTIAGCALAGLFTWFFNPANLISGFGVMKFNTSLCVFLLSLSLFFHSGNKRFNGVLALTAAVISLAISSFTFLEDLLNLNTALDELFVRDIFSQSVHPGRMAVNSSLCITLASIASLFIQSGYTEMKRVSVYLMHCVTLIAFIALTGYIYNIPVFYKLSFYVSMALPTAVSLLLLSVLATLMNPDYGVTGLFTGKAIGNVMARRFFPLATVTIIILGYLRIKSHQLQLVNVEFGIALFAISFLLVCLLLIVFTSRYLNQIDLKRSKAEHLLTLLNKTLEEKVEDRTKDLSASQKKFSQIFQMSPAGLIISDRETGRFLEINQSIMDLTGYTIDEMQGKTSAELGIIRSDERAMLVGILNEKGFIRNQDTIYYTKNGEAKNALISVETIDIGNKLIALTVLYDITERKLVEKAMIEAKTLAEQSAHAKERFLANMSHEIRTPMNAIIGFTNLFDKTQLTEEQQQYVRYIKNSGENLLVLINDILDYSKIEAGMMQLEKTPFRPDELVHSVKIMFGEKVREKKLGFIVETDKAIPNMLIGDPTRLTQILINLIGNAIKFTEKGSIKLNTDLVSVKDKECRIRIVISDTGIGIPAEKQHEVFERFMQANNETTRHYGGTGLGLSIVKNLVELQNGTIFLKSNTGEGTEFAIELPYEIGETEKINETSISASVTEIKKFDREVKVLLVEDNPVNQVLAGKVLSRFGCIADLAENGAIAVKMVSEKQYDLVLMDIQMPVMDGYTASRKIREELHLDIPIIAMTAHIMAGEKEKCLSNGMTDYISKPFKMEALYALILKYISE